MHKLQPIVGVKDLRENLDDYIAQIAKGRSFIVIKRSKPVFTISPIDDENGWETVIDFTKIRKGGVKIDEILSRL